jgi:hypothetical protein
MNGPWLARAAHRAMGLASALRSCSSDCLRSDRTPRTVVRPTPSISSATFSQSISAIVHHLAGRATAQQFGLALAPQGDVGVVITHVVPPTFRGWPAQPCQPCREPFHVRRWQGGEFDSVFSTVQVRPEFPRKNGGFPRLLEVRAGIEPTYADLQSAASPLCHRTPSEALLYRVRGRARSRCHGGTGAGRLHDRQGNGGARELIMPISFASAMGEQGKGVAPETALGLPGVVEPFQHSAAELQRLAAAGDYCRFRVLSDVEPRPGPHRPYRE